MDEKEYETLNDLFQHPGWQLFIDTAKELRETLVQTAPDFAVTNDRWQNTRGQILQLSRIIGYSNFIKASWEESQKSPELETDTDEIVI